MAVSLTVANSHLYCVGSTLPNTANPFSINVWIRATWSSGNTYSFVGLYNGTPGTGTPTTGAGLQIGTTAANEIACWTYGGSEKVTGTGMSVYDGLWIMTTYVYEGANVHRIYVNGALLATNTSAFTAAQMTQVYINGYPPSGNASETSAFAVDSYDSYNRALTANEILTLYNNAGARGGIVYEHACQYEFDEGIEGAIAGSGAGNAPSVVDMTGGGQPLLHTGGTNTTAYTYVGVFPNSNIRPVQ